MRCWLAGILIVACTPTGVGTESLRVEAEEPAPRQTVAVKPGALRHPVTDQASGAGNDGAGDGAGGGSGVRAEHACTNDAACITSCSQGAVNREWYIAMFPGGEACRDGCTSKGHGPARCDAGMCVAYYADMPDPLCTRRSDLVTVVQRPGPAHRCTNDEECQLSCTYGAVRSDWYRLMDRRAEECRDGCSSKGMSVRCEDGRCLALRMDEPWLGCTERSIYRPDG